MPSLVQPFPVQEETTISENGFRKRFSFTLCLGTHHGNPNRFYCLIGLYCRRLSFPALLPLHFLFRPFMPLIVVLLFTFINVLGIRFGTGTQKLLTVLQLTGILIIIGSGLFMKPNIDSAQAVMSEADASATTTSLSQALIFVLLTFGGWNEAAYVSSELKLVPEKWPWR